MQKFARIKYIAEALFRTRNLRRFYSKPSISRNSTHYNSDQINKVVIEGNLPDAALDPSIFTREVARIRKNNMRWRKPETANCTEVFLKNHLQGRILKLQSSTKWFWIFGAIPEGAAVVVLRRRFRFEVTALSKPLNSPRQAQLISTSQSHKSILTWEFGDLQKKYWTQFSNKRSCPVNLYPLVN